MAHLCIDQLEDFINRNRHHPMPRIQWLADGFMQVYVRRAFHLIGKDIVPTLDIANVGVSEHYQGQGRFKNFLTAAHELNPWTGTYIESVHNPILAEYLMRNNWERLEYECFYMKK